MEEQTKVNVSIPTEKVAKVIKQRENLVRDTVDRKKTVVVFALKEECVPQRQERVKKEKR